MDHPTTHRQNPNVNLDKEWINYFNQDHHDTDTHLFSLDDALFNLPDMNQVSPFIKQDEYYFSELGFPYFDPIDEDFNLWDCWNNGECNLPLVSCSDETVIDTKAGGGGGSGDRGGGNGWGRSRPLELEEIEKHFELPIVIAAKKLNVGLTMLKKRCRELNIKRWPHRKLKSIKSLIQNVKERGLNEEIKLLEEQKRMIEKLPEMDLTQRTKKLRQACFKANYKKRRIEYSPY